MADVATAEERDEDAARPIMLIVWGGIGAGKSTGTAALLEALGVPDDSFVKVGVDDLVELVPAYRAAVESGDPAKKEAAYMKYRGEAKKLKAPTLAAAIEQRRNIYLEWTYEGNLEKFANGEDAELPFLTASYDVVLLYVACPDVEGILRNAAKRERTIPEDTIRKFNLNRSKHFVEAVNGLHGLTVAAEQSALRVFVMERKTADAQGMLSEVMAALPLAASATITEEEAWAVVQAQLVQQESQDAAATGEAPDLFGAEQEGRPKVAGTTGWVPKCAIL